MLVELAVRDLGVISNVSITFDDSMTVLSGETGAGKTMVIEAISLLVGEKADPTRVRRGADAAEVEGRFVSEQGDEVILRRVVPTQGRSRAYIDGRFVTVSALAEVGADLVEICGQHSQQRLLHQSAQRRALDQFGSTSTEALEQARAVQRELQRELAAMGGDDTARARELDVLNYQLEELNAAGIDDENEDDELAAEQDQLGDVVRRREAAASAAQLLGTDDGAAGLLSDALSKIDGLAGFEGDLDTLSRLVAETADAAATLRHTAGVLEEDPERLDTIRRRRQQLVEMRRKYGDSLAEVMAFHAEAIRRHELLTQHDERREALIAKLAHAADAVDVASALVLEQRRTAAPKLAAEVEQRLHSVALPDARFEVRVEGTAGDDVGFLLSTHRGMDPSPLGRAASGGELSRTMLALSLILSDGAPTMIFDEVDAGLGGETAISVGEALAEVGDSRQVLVVTHLAQVAAKATHQLSVTKASSEVGTSTVVSLTDDDRVIELSRMLSGSPESSAARDHAAELLGAVSEAGAN